VTGSRVPSGCSARSGRSRLLFRLAVVDERLDQLKLAVVVVHVAGVDLKHEARPLKPICFIARVADLALDIPQANGRRSTSSLRSIH
jgi:hypothetical protein